MDTQPRYGHFNWIAPLYDRVFTWLDHNALFDHLQVGPGHVVLDIGGGTGRVAETLAETGARVIVVDPAPGMLAHARHKNLEAARAVAERLPFAANSIDRIYIVDAFHHFADQPAAARELVRVLRPGGRLVIEEPDLRRFAVKLVAVAEKVALMQSHFYSPPGLAALFSAAGAQVLGVSAEGFSAHVVLSK